MTSESKAPLTGKTPEWLQRKERGSVFLLRVMRWLSMALGRRLSRVVVYGIAAYFVLAAPAARKASRQYLAKVLERKITWLDLYRHIFAFSSTIHDRVYLLNDRHDLFDIHMSGADPLHALHARDGGLFLFGAHLGSFEVLRCLARDNPKLKVCIAMHPENARQVNDALTAINPRAMQDIVPLGHIDSMLAIHRKIGEGAMIGILADRAVGSDQYISVPFFGIPAHFPTGPFRMAAMLRHPVYFMAGLYLGGNRYDIHFELLADFSDLDHAEAGARDLAITSAVQKYVSILERHCRQAPFNWFNFYNFWEEPRRENN